MSEQKGFYITTAIVYPNSRMHIGFGWEVLSADLVSRFERMKGRPVFFCTGMDEHSQNVEKAAVKAALSPKAYCDQMCQDLTRVVDAMDVAYDRFIRTSDPDHEVVCRSLIENAHRSGDVYKQKYEGWYCDSCEVFYTEKEATPEGGGYVCVTHKTPLRLMSEENYFFKLSKYQDKLLDLFKRSSFLSPESRKNEVLTFIEQGLKDFSVSRTSFKWGIPVPFDPEHVIYVWYDALINYLSAVKFPVKDASGKVVQGDEEFFGRFWPCDIHVIGKDITRFHTVYWPAMLWSAGIALPEQVRAHGFLYFQGEKMSKSRGNIVTPDEVMADYGSTALRWFLLAGNHFENDGNYSDEALVLKCNADLSNNMGNLVNRVLSMTQKYFGADLPADRGTLPAGVEPVSARMKHHLGAKGEELEKAARGMDTSGYCARVVEFAVSMNKFIDETKPWSLAKAVAKDPNAPEKAQLETTLAQLLEGIRNLSIALWPVIPQAADAIAEQLGSTGALRSKVRLQAKLETGRVLSVPKLSELGFDAGYMAKHGWKLSAPQPIFPRLEFQVEKPS